MRLLTFLAKRFVAGDTVDQAKNVVRRLNDNRMTTTMDILGENVTNEEEALKATNGYLNLLEVIEREKLDSNVSLKLTMLGLDQGADFCTANLRMIVEKAKSLSNFVRVDMEGSPYTQRTLDVFNSVYREFPDNVGIVIQAYLYRSKDDIKALNKIGATVRLCKGAYKEPPEIAHKSKKNLHINYLDLSRTLLEGGRYPAFATHDVKLITELKNYVREKKISKDGFEFQMLYGIRRKVSAKLADEGYKVRIYVPFGTHWLPYTLRRLRERKENVFFVIKSLFTD